MFPLWPLGYPFQVLARSSNALTLPGVEIKFASLTLNP